MNSNLNNQNNNEIYNFNIKLQKIKSNIMNSG